jgi:hypothetical protein
MAITSDTLKPHQRSYTPPLNLRVAIILLVDDAKGSCFEHWHSGSLYHGQRRHPCRLLVLSPPYAANRAAPQRGNSHRHVPIIVVGPRLVPVARHGPVLHPLAKRRGRALVAAMALRFQTETLPGKSEEAKSRAPMTTGQRDVLNQAVDKAQSANLRLTRH